MIHDCYQNEKLSFKDYEIQWKEFMDTHTEAELVNAVEKTTDWRFFYFFSPMREAVLKWYDFSKESTVLLIGAGYGEIIGVLCEKCSKVVAIERYREKAYIIQSRYKERNNLDVYIGKLQEDNTEKFDYIIFGGSFGYQCNGSKSDLDYEIYLKSLHKYCKDHTKLLIIAENRLGAEYLCGKPAPSTGVPFDTLSGSSDNSKYRGFTTQELVQLIHDAGFIYHKVYYPFPNYLFTQEVYTEEYQPTEKVMERVLQYHTYMDTVIADEDKLMCDFIKMGAFQCVANSYIIEASSKVGLGDVIYASCTMDRGKEHGFVTMIHENQMVTKKTISEKWNQAIRDLYNNMEQLRIRGVPVIDQTILCDRIQMPRISAPTLSEYLMTNTSMSCEQFYNVFDKLYEYILQSSAISDRCDFPGISQMDEIGPVLKHAYIDMVPFNCFVLDQCELLFFDQEFERENYPAGYIMYRALMYSYHFIKNLEDIVPLNQMKERYGLVNAWKAYGFEEMRFVAQNRRYDRNPLFWQNTSKKYLSVINENRNRLLYKMQMPIKMEQTKAENSDKEYGLGYIAGVFDLFHVGHLNLLKKAKEKCDYLLVGVLTDELVEHFKGSKPYISLKERLEIIGASKFVDEVVPVDFTNIDKVDAWNLYHFDCLFSGDDWKGTPQWEEDRIKLKALGSDICFFGYTQSTSSTQIKKMIREGRL